MEGASDYLPDSDEEQNTSFQTNEAIEEKPKVISKQRANARDNGGSVKDDNSDSLIPYVASHEEGEGSPYPEGENSGQNGNVHDTRNETGFSENGEDEIMKTASLTGLKSRVLILNKNEGEYLITFKSISDEKECELELFYLDDMGNKYRPNIKSCLINDVEFPLSEGKIKGFDMKKDVRYKILVKTNLDDIYACEVNVYAIR
jgi:hypothetical protein